MTELRRMFALAIPVVAAELGWVAMGVVDTLMIGRVDAESIGAVGIGRTLFFAFMVLGIGVMLGLDPLIAAAHGGGKVRECRIWLVQGLWLALLLGVPMTLCFLLGVPLLDRMGIDPGVASRTAPYLAALAWSSLPLLVYSALRRHLQAVDRPGAVTFALISANAVNVLANWVLIFGNLGAPALGAEGAGWATVISCVYLATFLAVAVIWTVGHESPPAQPVGWRPHPGRLRRVLALGLPAALQLMIEVGVFAAGTLLAGWLAPPVLAAHQIALVAASTTYMVPLGIASAGAVRVGQALGRRDPTAAAHAGWTALAMGAGFMLIAAAIFLILPRSVVGAFSSDTAVLAAGVTLLRVAALFQLFDGVQVVATGVLRGVGDTRTPLVWSIIGYWVLALPIGAYLCFGRGMGAVGLWTGWLVGLGLVAIVLCGVWWRRVQAPAWAHVEAPGYHE